MSTQKAPCSPVERSTSKYRDMLSESLDKAIAAETRQLRERQIEAEAEHAQAMMRLSDHYRYRRDRDGRMMAWICVWSLAGGVAFGWMVGRL